MNVYDCPQGGDEWLALRLGIPTSSCFDKILTPKTLELSKSSRPYMCQLLAEWMYGAPLEAFVSPWMERGKDLEAEAVRYYELARECDTEAVGFVTTDDGMIGASPDRLAGADGVVELKCPELKTHVGYMLEPESLLVEYRMQVQGQLWVCERQWADMQSYYPGFPAVLLRAQRDEKVIAALEKHVSSFAQVMLAARAKLTEMYGELRRERITAEQVTEGSRAAFDAFMDSPIGGTV
jgi:hypothetical protein